jgi:hypothetical protein
MSYQVFISYSKDDRDHADAVCRHLENFNIGCWIAPRNIHPSEDWAEAIITAMDNSKILLLIFSATSNNSPQVRREVERAVNKGLSILPFRIEDVALSKSMEYFISAQHWLDAFDGNTEAHMKLLTESILRTLGQQMPAQEEKAPEKTPAAPIVAPAAVTVSAEILASLENILAQTMGPIARHLIKRKAAAGLPARDLVVALSLEIDNESERRQFLSRTASIR